jgi:hypothetical protein
MTVDAGAVLRLQSAIRSTTDGLNGRQLAGNALSQAYAGFRGEALRVATDANALEEFVRLFPEGPKAQPAGFQFGNDPFREESEANESLGLLLRLAGWLEGFNELAQVEANATAYADARISYEEHSN